MEVVQDFQEIYGRYMGDYKTKINENGIGRQLTRSIHKLC